MELSLLQKKYLKETGEDPDTCDESGYIVFTMEYVKWLENKINQFQESTKTYLDLLRKEGI